MSRDVVYCVECGQAVAPTASFCKACGARQAPEEGLALSAAREAHADEPAAPASGSVAAGVTAPEPPPAGPGGVASAPPKVGSMPPPTGRPHSQVPEWQRSMSATLRFTRDEWIVAGCALGLFIDLLALPWFEISAGSFSVSWTATQEPDGWLGVLAVLGCVALIAYLLVDRLSPQTQLPVVGGSRATTRLLLAVVPSALVALKFILHVHFSLFGAGFYISFILAIVLIVFAELARRHEHHAASSMGL